MKVSFILPTKNSSETILNCIDSILNQSKKDWELIIVDGCSNDSTIDLINKFSSKDPRIKVYIEKDKNYAEAINKGFKYISGDYVFIISSDNWLQKNALKNLESHTSKNNLIIYGDFLFINKKKSKYGYYYSTDVLDMPYRMSICPEALIFSKTILSHVGLYDDKISIAADHDFFLRIFNKFGPEKFKKCNELITYFVAGGLADKQRYLAYYQTMKNSLRLNYNPFIIILNFIYNTSKLLIKDIFYFYNFKGKYKKIHKIQ